jgi:hypothetical protein
MRGPEKQDSMPLKFIHDGPSRHLGLDKESVNLGLDSRSERAYTSHTKNKLVGSCTRKSLLHLGRAGEESDTETLNSQAVNICTAPRNECAGAFRRALVAPQGITACVGRCRVRAQVKRQKLRGRDWFSSLTFAFLFDVYRVRDNPGFVVEGMWQLVQESLYAIDALLCDGEFGRLADGRFAEQRAVLE